MPEKGFDILMGRIKTRIINKEIDLAGLLDKEEKRALERQSEINALRADRDALEAWLKKLQRRTKKDDPLVERYNYLWGLAGFKDRMPGDSENFTGEDEGSSECHSKVIMSSVEF